VTLKRLPRSMRFDLTELLLICAVCGLTVWSYERAGRSYIVDELYRIESAPLRAQFGPNRYSQVLEEWIIRDHFHDRREGIFIDVGAGDYRKFSNTYYLETHLGWSGVAVDPQRSFEDGYRNNRPKTTFLPFFVSDVSDQEATLYISQRRQMSSGNREWAQSGAYVPLGQGPVGVKVPTIRLTDLCDRMGLRKIDFLSIDVESFEPKVLAGFDIERFQPDLVCIEAQLPVRQQILDYFARHGYTVVGKYLRADSLNLYFAPLRSLN
jgi:FkbM family methyltransferase